MIRVSKPKNDISNMRFGNLTAIEYVGNSKWLCKCDCENETFVKTCNLTNGHTKSCGCIAKKQSVINGRKRLMDLTGKRFGKLEVKSYLGKSKWLCKCDCGKTAVVAQNNLCRKGRPTRSCGCDITLGSANQINFVGGTNVGNIKTDKATSRSSTGIRGVYFSKSLGKYVATIGFQHKHYTLKVSSDINVCIAARKKAEKQVFGDFLEWYDKEYKNSNKKSEENEDEKSST